MNLVMIAITTFVTVIVASEVKDAIRWYRVKRSTTRKDNSS